MLRRLILDAASATLGVALLTAALLVSSALEARAQETDAETGGILGLLADPPPERRAEVALDHRALNLAEAVLLSERLADDVLVLTRIANLQVRLLETNATRAAAGAEPLLLPRTICTDSALAAMCGRLPHTFAPGESP